MVTIEEFRALCKTANRKMTFTEDTVQVYDPESFSDVLAFAQFYETVREMAVCRLIESVPPYIATGLRIFHKAIDSLFIHNVTAFEILGTMAMVVPQRSLPRTASGWMAVLRAIGWEDGDLAAYIEELDASAWEDD